MVSSTPWTKLQSLVSWAEGKPSWKMEDDAPILFVGPSWNNAVPKAKKIFLQHVNTYFLDGQEGFIAFDIYDARSQRKIARWGNFEPYVD